MKVVDAYASCFALALDFLMGMVIATFVTAVFSTKIGVLSAIHPVFALGMFWSSLAIASRTSMLLNRDRLDEGLAKSR